MAVVCCLFLACSNKAQETYKEKEVNNLSSDQNSVVQNNADEVSDEMKAFGILGNSQYNMQTLGICCYDEKKCYIANLDGIYQLDYSSDSAKIIIPGTCYDICSIGNWLVYIKSLYHSADNGSYLCLYNKSTCVETALFEFTKNNNAKLLNTVNTKIYYCINNGNGNETYSYDILSGENEFVCPEGKLVTETGIYYIKDQKSLTFRPFNFESEETIASGEYKPLFTLNNELYLIASDILYKINLDTKEMETLLDNRRVSSVTPIRNGFAVLFDFTSLYLYDNQFNDFQKIIEVEDGDKIIGTPFPQIANGDIYFTFWPGLRIYKLEEGLTSYKELSRNDTIDNFTTNIEPPIDSEQKTD